LNCRIGRLLLLLLLLASRQEIRATTT